MTYCTYCLQEIKRFYCFFFNSYSDITDAVNNKIIISVKKEERLLLFTILFLIDTYITYSKYKRLKSNINENLHIIFE